MCGPGKRTLDYCFFGGPNWTQIKFVVNVFDSSSTEKSFQFKIPNYTYSLS